MPCQGRSVIGKRLLTARHPQSTLAGDIAQCVPVNRFGNGKVTDAARDYLLHTSNATGQIIQFDLTGFLNGDTSGFFNLPGGPIGFVVGGEYRRETADYKQDDATSSGIAFAHLLTVSAAGRVSNYKGSTGTVYSFNAGDEYAPLRALRFRGNCSRAVSRAERLGPLHTAQPEYFGFSDPCTTANISSGTQYRATNCAAAGVPAVYNYTYKVTPGYLSGGNTSLKAEVSDSITLGGVLTPGGILRGF